MLWKFLGYAFAFAAVLYCSLFLGEAGPVLIGGGAVLALLTLLLWKLEQVEKKLDKLSEQKEEE